MPGPGPPVPDSTEPSGRRLGQTLRRSLGLPEKPGPSPAAAPPLAPLPEPGPASLQIARLRREIARLEQRGPRGLAPQGPMAPPCQPAFAWPGLPARSEPEPEPVDRDGLLYQTRFPPGERFGEARIEAPSEQDLPGLRTLFGLCGALPAGPPIAAGDVLFLDLETTGLSRGAGTLPFLTGLGGFEPDGAFRVDQLFLRDPALEARVLDLLMGRLRTARALVTFNGRSFDLPLLRNRFILLRQDPSLLLNLPHLDLLMPCRRLFRPRLLNCRQQTLEQDLLGFARHGDVDGSEVPAIYQQFLYSGRFGRLADVLLHNRLDVALMAPILLRLALHASLPLHWGEDAEELLGTATLHLAQGDPALGMACLHRALELGGSPRTRQRAFRMLCATLRREGRKAELEPVQRLYRSEFPRKKRRSS